MKSRKIALIAISTLALTAVAIPQFKQILKIIGVGAAVKQFAPDIDKSLNKLTNFEPTKEITTKVVPIISGGLDSRKAIGAAQVMGPRNLVLKVTGVVQFDQDLFGREIKIRAMIPVEKLDGKNITRVEGVGVSGVVDLKL